MRKKYFIKDLTNKPNYVIIKMFQENKNKKKQGEKEMSTKEIDKKMRNPQVEQELRDWYNELNEEAFMDGWCEA